MTPLLTAVTFEFRMGESSPEQRRFLFEPEDKADSAWLSETKRDFNQLLKVLAQAPQVNQGNITVVWDDGVRALIPLPLYGTVPNLATVGDLVEQIARMLQTANGMDAGKSKTNTMLRIAERIRRLPKNAG